MTDQQLAQALHSAGFASVEAIRHVARQRMPGESLAAALVRQGIVDTSDILQFDPNAFPSESEPEFEAEFEPEWVGMGSEDAEMTDDDVLIIGEPGGYDPAQGPVIRYTSELLRLAVRMRASDMHLEPREDGLLPRFRIDGQLQPGAIMPPDLALPVVSRFKILANLDITETRLPQDGRFRATVGGKTFDFRVSTLPILHGEKVVLRLLDRSSLVVDLLRLGFSRTSKTQFEAMLARSHGMILVTGPTGSGKTTTLYAALAAAQDDTKNVITVEDPVEYELLGVSQTNVHSEIGLSFAAALRSILRQDPDVVLVGEIRDAETADIAVRAALTGHLLLSTLHTNSAVAAVTRLQDMDVPPFLIASSLSGVVAQRLVRMICRNCRYELSEDDPERIAALSEFQLPPDVPLYRGSGCPNCRNSGFRGRLAVLELLHVDAPMRKAIVEKHEAGELRRVAVENGLRSLWQDGRDKMLAGLVSPAELSRALMGFEE